MASELKPMMKALKAVREVNDKGRQAVKAWADSKTRPAPAATDTGLVTVGSIYINQDGECEETNYYEGTIQPSFDYQYLCLRSQAEELLAEKEAERAEQWRLRREMEADRDTQKAIATSLEAELAAERAEKFKWMEATAIEAGRVGRLKDELKAIIHDLNRIKDHETELVNDNAAQAARIKELEAALDSDPSGSDLWRYWSRKACEASQKYVDEVDRAEALEAKLAAAEADAIGYRSTIDHLTQRAETAEASASKWKAAAGRNT